MTDSSVSVQRRTRDALAIVLTVNTGVTDALGFICLGGAFTSVMTGNMVLLGLAAGTGDGKLARLTAAAIACYIAGTALGTRVVGQHRSDDPLWPARVTRGLAIEFAVIAVFAICWELTGGRPGGIMQLILLMINAVALGIQAASVNCLGVSGLSTTFLTGTLTRVVTHLTSGKPARQEARSIGILVGLTGGAVVGGALTKFAPLAAPVAQLASLVAVVLMARRSFGRQPVRGVIGSADSTVHASLDEIG